MSAHLSHTQESSRLSGFSVLMGTLVGALSGLYLQLFLPYYFLWLLQVPIFHSLGLSLSPLSGLSLSPFRGTYLQWLMLDGLVIGGIGSLAGTLVGYFRRRDLTVVVSVTVAISLASGYALIASGDLFSIPQAIGFGTIPGIAGGLGGWYSVSKVAVSFNKNLHIPFFIILLATGLTLVSLLFVYSQHNGLQSAGFPIPVIRDHTGSSPISGWGVLGPEDTITVLPCLSIPLNVMLYSALLWFMQKVIFRGPRVESES